MASPNSGDAMTWVKIRFEIADIENIALAERKW
jgi:hypothetical protein